MKWKNDNHLDSNKINELTNAYTDDNYWSPLTSRPTEHEQQVQKGVLNGTIPSGISDTGASSRCAPATEKAVLRTGSSSTKTFVLPNGETVPATERALLQHELRGVARDVEIVPGLKENVLLSTGKMVDEGYIAVYDRDECRIYDGKTAKFQVSAEAVLKGWRCHKTGQ